jgi:pimeloyl-ACP methyl ester carboxylesterase
MPDHPMDAIGILHWLEELIRKTCSSPPIIVGHVVGGAIAARYALRPNRPVERLVLVDSLGLAPFEPTPEFGTALNAFFSDPNETTHDRFWTRCAFDLDALRNQMGDQWEDLKRYNLDRAMSVDRRKAAQNLIEEFGTRAIPDSELAKINVPVILIWGRNDLATKVSVAEDTSIRLGWPLHVVEDAADDPAIEQPNAFLAALRSSLADQNGG